MFPLFSLYKDEPMAISYCEMRDILSDYIHLNNYIPKEPLHVVELAVDPDIRRDPDRLLVLPFFAPII